VGTMKWNLQKTTDPSTGEDIFDLRIKISKLDVIKMVQFDLLDKLLLKECEASESCADKLLALETLVRRIEQGQEKTTQTPS